MDTQKFQVVVIGGSAGSFPVINAILSNLPDSRHYPVILCLHRLKQVRHGFKEALALHSKWEIREPDDKERALKGTVYLAPANYHLLFDYDNRFALNIDAPINHSRPAIDITCETASYWYRSRLLGILLSGANKDGASGLKKIRDRNGITIVQDPEEAQIATMPNAALNLSAAMHTMDTTNIIGFLNQNSPQPFLTSS